MASENNADTENNEPKQKQKQNNWIAFIINILIIFAVVFGIGLFGANFVYFTRIDLDNMFPNDPVHIPYVDEVTSGPNKPAMGGGRKMKGGSRSGVGGCGEYIDFTESSLFNNKYFSGMFKYGFPYSMESKEGGFFNTIFNWIVNKIKYSYIWQRTFIKQVIGFVGSSCEFPPDSMKDIVPFIFGPLVIGFIILITSLWWLPTLVSVFVNETQKWGWLISILGLFFGWTWLVTASILPIQILGVLFTFILLPVILNGRKILEIIGNEYNSYYLGVLFLIATIVVSFINLSYWTAVPLSIVCLYGLIPPYFRGQSNK